MSSERDDSPPLLSIDTAGAHARSAAPATVDQPTAPLHGWEAVEVGLSILQLLVFFLSVAISFAPARTTTGPTAAATPAAAVPEAALVSSSALCTLVDPAVGLGAGDYQSEPYGGFCTYAHPPAAPGFVVTVVASTAAVSDTATPVTTAPWRGLPPDVVDLLRHPGGPTDADRAAAAAAAHAAAGLNPNTVVTVNVYPTTSSPTDPSNGLALAVVEALQQRLPDVDVE